MLLMVVFKQTSGVNGRGCARQGAPAREGVKWKARPSWRRRGLRRMRFLVIENSMTRNAISASTFPGHPRCNSTPSCWVSMLRGVRFCSSLHLLSELAAWGSMRHLKIRSLQEAENPAIPRLLAQAWADGLKRVEQLHHR